MSNIGVMSYMEVMLLVVTVALLLVLLALVVTPSTLTRLPARGQVARRASTSDRGTLTAPPVAEPGRHPHRTGRRTSARRRAATSCVRPMPDRVRSGSSH
jgi:hypothetical protein